MQRQKKTSRALVPEDALRNPGQWALISQREAAGLWRRQPVVVVSGNPGNETARWYDATTQSTSGEPGSAGAARYFRYTGALPIIFDARRFGAPPFESIEKEGEPADEEVFRRRGPAEDTGHWIEIELVDKKGRPVPSARYHIELPDSSIAEDKLDSQGKARIDGIDPGSCKITFLDFDGREWRPLLG